jgi:tripartite-type tricarboxylate transporter receptor subunit TctC
MIESGVADFDIDTWFGLFGPAGLAPATRDALVAAATAALRSQPVAQALDRLGAAAAPLAPAAFATFVRQEQRKYQALVEASGATAD